MKYDKLKEKYFIKLKELADNTYLYYIDGDSFITVDGSIKKDNLWKLISQEIIPLVEKEILTKLLEMAKNEPDELTNELKKNINKLLKQL